VASSCPNTVIYSGTVAQVIKQATYCAIVFSNNGIKTISTPVTANGAVIINSGTQVDVTSSGVFSIKGDLENSGVLNVAGAVTD
jgi:hypothetical protein